MEPKRKTQIIEVGGSKYRLSKLDARSASYIAFKSAGIVAPLMGKGKTTEIYRWNLYQRYCRPFPVMNLRKYKQCF